MISGLYGSAANLEALSRQQEATASNLAHLNTPGHRRVTTGFSEWLEAEQHNGEPYPNNSLVTGVDHTNRGRLEQTERSLDWALEGDVFFAFQGAEDIMYSRNGVIFRNSDTNQLVNSDGFALLDSDGQPLIYEGALDSLTVTRDGSLFAGAQRLGKVGIYSFDDNRLLDSRNQIYFLAGNATPTLAENYQLHQGFRELSNANPTTELISLIVGSRHFEATQRAIRTISDAIQENIRS